MSSARFTGWPGPSGADSSTSPRSTIRATSRELLEGIGIVP
ncbi:hypothetical protein [Streptomyces gardneri]